MSRPPPKRRQNAKSNRNLQARGLREAVRPCLCCRYEALDLFLPERSSQNRAGRYRKRNRVDSHRGRFGCGDLRPKAKAGLHSLRRRWRIGGHIARRSGTYRPYSARPNSGRLPHGHAGPRNWPSIFDGVKARSQCGTASGWARCAPACRLVGGVGRKSVIFASLGPFVSRKA